MTLPRTVRRVLPFLLLLLSSFIASPALHAAQLVNVGSTGQAIHYSRMAIWGQEGGACILGFSDQRTLTFADADVCIDAVFSTWQGYHRGRLSVTAPNGAAHGVNFHGTHGHHVLRDFALKPAHLAGQWMVTLRVDGNQVASTDFTVVSPTSTPTVVPTSTPRPISTAVPIATSVPPPTATPVPALPDASGLMLPASAFAPAQPSTQPWGVVDVTGANASYFATPHMHRASYDSLGFRSGAYQQADWNDGTTNEVEFFYLGGVYTDANAAARAWQDGVNTLQTGWNTTPVNCQTASTGAQCAEGMFWTPSGAGETYVVTQYNQCTLEVMASYGANGPSQGGEIVGVVNAITAAAQQAAARVCAWNGAPVATVAPVIASPAPTAPPYVPPSSNPTAVAYPTSTPYPVYYPPPGGGGLCNDHDHDDEGLPPGSNDYDTNGCN